jgi:hypothetical protein
MFRGTLLAHYDGATLLKSGAKRFLFQHVAELPEVSQTLVYVFTRTKK